MHEVQLRGTRIARHLVPGSLDEALDLLAEHGASARLIAGGTDLLLELAHRSRPGVEVLVDLTRIPGLAGIEADGPDVRIGCLVTHGQVVASSICRNRLTPLAQACREVASP
ncbi:MAG: FAD binding domain-containing protein, partial [Acidimicrobiia bacterium]|nr:FAD binding domain-containing protein [Acidimicrobiia bacterium]